MFWHEFKYDFLTCLRTKEVLFWLILFPLFLGTIFKICFSNINISEFTAIETAIVEVKENPAFDMVLEEICKGDEPLLSAVHTDKEQALKLLEENEVAAIIYVDEELSLSVSGTLTGQQIDIKKTIIKTFTEQFNLTQELIIDTAANNPGKLGDVIAALSEEVSAVEKVSLTDGNMDNMLAYFHNLIAMVGLLGSNIGIYIAIDIQANLSPKGARRNCSPTKKSVSMAASLASRFLEQAICVAITITYLLFVLKVDLGGNIPLIYAAGIMGGMVGVAFGFFVGSFGRMSESAKASISTAASLISCFFSGLMIANMKGVMDMVAPWFNEINPAAIISDTFYCLTIYDDYERFTQKIISMAVLILIFSVGGFLLTRRRRYASL